MHRYRDGFDDDGSRPEVPLEECGQKQPPPAAPTVVGAPIHGDTIVIMNRAGEDWVVYLRYHQLAMLAPSERVVVHTPRRGLLSARPLNAPSDTEYLLAQLSPRTWAVEIVETTGLQSYGLHLHEGPVPEEHVEAAAFVSGAESIEDLDLSARAENALKRAGVLKVSQVVELSREDLLSIRKFGDQGYAELVGRLRAWRRLSGGDR